jgi:hypothetical protein
MNEGFRCPTCRAPWRGVIICPRCGSDLSAIMRVAAKAWELREAVRLALCASDHPEQALALAQAACRLHATPHGQRLLALALVAARQESNGRQSLAEPVRPPEASV